MRAHISGACFALAVVAGPAALMSAADRAAAFGALAIGETGNIAKGGVAAGASRNYANKDAAEARALKECLSFPDAPAATRAKCRIVASFEKRCYAAALDPKAGTPGFGWAVRASRTIAESAAMDDCRDTAGKRRAKFCKVTMIACDETNSRSQ